MEEYTSRSEQMTSVENTFGLTMTGTRVVGGVTASRVGVLDVAKKYTYIRFKLKAQFIYILF